MTTSFALSLGILDSVSIQPIVVFQVTCWVSFHRDLTSSMIDTNDEDKETCVGTRTDSASKGRDILPRKENIEQIRRLGSEKAAHLKSCAVSIKSRPALLAESKFASLAIEERLDQLTQGSDKGMPSQGETLEVAACLEPDNSLDGGSSGVRVTITELKAENREISRVADQRRSLGIRVSEGEPGAPFPSSLAPYGRPIIW